MSNTFTLLRLKTRPLRKYAAFAHRKSATYVAFGQRKSATYVAFGQRKSATYVAFLRWCPVRVCPVGMVALESCSYHRATHSQKKSAHMGHKMFQNRQNQTPCAWRLVKNTLKSSYCEPHRASIEKICQSPKQIICNTNYLSKPQTTKKSQTSGNHNNKNKKQNA